MTAFNRYVFRQLLVGLILVTAGLTCVIWLSQSLRFVEMIINRGLSVGTFVYFTGLLLPNFLSIILPITLFTIVVFTYNRLINDRELVIMEGAGLSGPALARPALVIAGAIVVVGYGLSLYLVPETYRMFRELQWEIRYDYSHILLQEGTFNNVSPGLTIYIRERSAEGQLLGVFAHDSRNEANPFTLMAERGVMVDSEQGARVVLFKGSRQNIDKKTGQLSVLTFDEHTFNIKTQKEQGVTRYREARERPLSELFDLENQKYVSPRDYGRFTVEAHKRLVTPFYALGYALVGLACLLSGGFGQRAQTRRVTLAIACVVALQGAALGLENLAARNLDLVPLLYLHAVLPIIAGYWLMVRPPRRRRVSSLAAAGGAA